MEKLSVRPGKLCYYPHLVPIIILPLYCYILLSKRILLQKDYTATSVRLNILTSYWLLFIFRIIALLGLFLISVGTGGIKPCVFTFGGDQFRLPEQEKQLLHYTTKFTFAINVGALFSTFLTPELRQSVHCLGRDTCFPLAFGVPAVLMLIAIGNYHHFLVIILIL